MTRRLPFRELLHQSVGEGATPFPGLLHFTLDTYLILLSVKQGGIKYHFLKSLVWLDLGLNPGLLGHWRTLTVMPMSDMIIMMKEKNTPIQNDPESWTAPNNYRPITCLPSMRKILTTENMEKIYYLSISRGLFPEQQKECHKGQNEQESYCILISTSSRKAKRGAEFWLWCGLITERYTI